MKFFNITILLLLFGTAISSQTVFGDQVNATKNSFACVNFSGESQQKIVALQAEFSWDASLLSFLSVTQSSNIAELATNLDNIHQGEFRMVYLQDLHQEGINYFNFKICFQVIGDVGQTAEVKILDHEIFPFEVTVLNPQDSSGTDSVYIIDYEMESSFVTITEDQDDCALQDAPLECLVSYSKRINEDGDLIVFAEDLLISSNPNSLYELFSNDPVDLSGTGFIHMNCNSLQDSLIELSIQNICTGEVCSTLIKVLGYNNACNDLVEVAGDEIPLQMRPTPIHSFNFGKILINGTPATEYYNGVYGLPKSALTQYNNEVSFEPIVDNQLQGMTTLDEVLLIRHLLGFELLSGWQIVAADIDQSGNLSFTRDFVTHRQIILGEIQKLPGDNFFLAPRDNPIPDDIDGFNFQSDYQSFSFNRSDINEMEGIIVDVYKYGDVNDNFSVNPRSNESIILEIEDIYLEAGKDYVIPIRLKDADKIDDYLGMQLSIEGKFNNLEIGTHEYGDKLQTYNPTQSQLNISLVSETKLNNFEFEVKFQAKESGWLSNFLKLNEDFATEYISELLDLFEVNIEFFHAAQDDLILENQIQIFPNPVFSELTIKIGPEMVGKELEIFNILGQVQFRKVIKEQTILMGRDELGSAGLKYIRIGHDIIQEVIVLN